MWLIQCKVKYIEEYPAPDLYLPIFVNKHHHKYKHKHKEIHAIGMGYDSQVRNQDESSVGDEQQN